MRVCYIFLSLLPVYDIQVQNGGYIDHRPTVCWCACRCHVASSYKRGPIYVSSWIEYTIFCSNSKFCSRIRGRKPSVRLSPGRGGPLYLAGNARITLDIRLSIQTVLIMFGQTCRIYVFPTSRPCRKIGEERLTYVCVVEEGRGGGGLP